MREWLRFFIGTPQRFLTTAVFLGMATVIAFPGLLRTAIERLLTEVQPLFAPVFTILIVFAGLRIMFGGRR